MTSVNGTTILGLDVGTRRIGIARALLSIRMARPLLTLENPDTFLDDIVDLVRQEDAAAVVIGLPRNMSGEDTDQTRLVRAFGTELTAKLDVPVLWTDEALTSQKAEDELAGRGKPYAKGEVDALAATYIVEDYLAEHPEVAHV